MNSLRHLDQRQIIQQFALIQAVQFQLNSNTVKGPNWSSLKISIQKSTRNVNPIEISL